MHNVDHGSFCSGIEATTVAWHPMGYRAAWYTEIKPFPSDVLAHRYSNTPNLGDITRLPALEKKALITKTPGIARSIRPV